MTNLIGDIEMTKIGEGFIHQRLVRAEKFGSLTFVEEKNVVGEPRLE